MTLTISKRKVVEFVHKLATNSFINNEPIFEAHFGLLKAEAVWKPTRISRGMSAARSFDVLDPRLGGFWGLAAFATSQTDPCALSRL
jgi:hypothetical protein